MSEFEPELGYEEPYEHYDDPGAEGFEPDGEVGPLGEVELAQAMVEYERETEQWVDPGSYAPLEGLSPEAEQTQWAAQMEASQQLARSDYEAALVSRVTEAGKEREYGVTSPQAIQEAASQVDEVRRGVFTRCARPGL